MPDPSPCLNPQLGILHAVIVTHHPGGAFSETLCSVLSQADHVHVVDNASGEASRNALAALQAQHAESVTLLLREDANLAAAQNLGISAARERGAEWVLLVDHDSILDTQMLPRMAEAFRLLPPGQQRQTALLAPAFFDRHSERSPRYLRSWGKYGFRWSGFSPHSAYLDELLCAIASGSLIRMQALNEVGGMDESYFIDDVDREFCLRLRARGYTLAAIRDAYLYHRIGHSSDHRLLGIRVTSHNHNAERRFTIYRNRVRNRRRYGRKFPGFVLFDLLATALDITRLLLCESHKIAKLCAMAKGAWQGATYDEK